MSETNDDRRLSISNERLVWQGGPEVRWVEAWGENAIRVRSAFGEPIRESDAALLPRGEADPELRIESDTGILGSGRIRAEVLSDGRVRLLDRDDRAILEEMPAGIGLYDPGRTYTSVGGGRYRVSQEFVARDGERFYGLGQHPHGMLDQKGCTIDLFHHNTEFAIPFAVSNRGYGMLWHHPGIGRVELSRNMTRWSSNAARQMDYWVTAGSYAEIMREYARATGMPPLMPDSIAGFWQCKLRYKTQDELMAVAREHKRRGLPMDVIVVDFFHWTAMGEWRFDPDAWPDPEGMVGELQEMGIEVLISIWPTVNGNADTFEEMEERNLLVRSVRGRAAQRFMGDNKPGLGIKTPVYFYDATNPEARKYLWEKVRDNYLSLGIRMWWLDCDEPEFQHYEFENVQYFAGNGEEVSSLYPNLHAKAFHDGMKQEGETDVVLLSRAGWAGIQRYGTVLWSGDIPSTFDVFKRQVPAGLNVSMSGIPWWNTDIGGFFRGHLEEDRFRELLIRWFQYGTFCPVMRLHGFRSPNEVWSFGEEAFQILKKYLFVRERIKPYILEQMRAAHESGAPIMRPLFFDFPGDRECEDVPDQYMFGPGLLVAPVTGEGARSRPVYLPAGAKWTDAWTGEDLPGGQTIEAPAPLDRIPLYFRDGAKRPIAEE